MYFSNIVYPKKWRRTNQIYQKRGY